VPNNVNAMQLGNRPHMLSRLASYLEAQQQSIADQWLLAVRRDAEIDTATRLTHQQLLDHLPDLYAELCTFLRERDADVLQEEVQRDARKHGGHRWHDGYRLEEVLREVEILRRTLVTAILIRFGEMEPDFKGAVEITAHTLLGEFFSALTIGSIKQFVDEQEAVRAQYAEELRQTNQSLQRALSQRQRLTSVVAHELRNFVQALDYTTRLSTRRPQDTRAQELAQQQIKDMHELLQQLLDHSTMIGEAQVLNVDQFDPRQLCDEVIATYRPGAEAKGLRLLLENRSAPASVQGDRLRTKQVIANLVSNAVKYTVKGEVSVSVGASNDAHWFIKVSDTGPGITAEAGARLIEGLGSADETLPGRGIGLGITKDLVDLLGGSIRVVSMHQTGSLFEVLLPQNISTNCAASGNS
jgi:signal transduction histidine kinase